MKKRRAPRRPGRPQTHPRALANLWPAPPAPPEGNTRSVTHGFFAEKTLLKDVSAEVRELSAAIASICPVRNGDGSLPDADVLAVERCARALRRWRVVSAHCDLRGRFDEKGNEKACAGYELRAERALADASARLGLDPESRARLLAALSSGSSAADRLVEHLRQAHGGAA